MADRDNGNHPPEEAKAAAFGIVVLHKIVEIPGHGTRLMVGFQLQGPGGVPLSHMMEVPGEVLPVIIASLQAVIDEFPALTKDLCEIGPSHTMTEQEVQATKPSGLVDPAGKPISPLKIVKKH